MHNLTLKKLYHLAGILSTLAFCFSLAGFSQSKTKEKVSETCFGDLSKSIYSFAILMRLKFI